MGSSTVILILKSLLPFMKEILFKDRLLRELFLENKIATILAGCVLFLFVLVAHVSEVASAAAHENARLAQANEYLTSTNTELRDRISKLEDRLDAKGPVGEGPTEHRQPSKPTVKPQAVKPTKKRKDQSLKSYIERKFKALE